MESISQTLERLDALRQTQARQGLVEPINQPSASIEETVSITNTSIELPVEIDNLIDNKMFRPKFRKLIRDGHLHDLLELAEIAKTKGRPSRWYATVTAKANWEKTKDFLAKLHEVAQAAQEVAARLLVPAKHLNAVYKACWRTNGITHRLAVKAEETARGDKFKYFCWLCFKTDLSPRSNPA